MFNEFKEVFANDYIRMGRKVIRPFSIMWWVVKTLNCFVAIVGMYAIYCTIWMIGA